ncbi:hypothetical protein LXL04_011528 [Taraxacum kok-saghyz]
MILVDEIKPMSLTGSSPYSHVKICIFKQQDHGTLWDFQQQLKGVCDQGLGPIPIKWRGECQGGVNFTCNRKIMGARSYGIEESVRDYKGHGTHVASILAGKQVQRSDMLSAFDDAISDGVDIIAVSLRSSTEDVTSDPIAIGAFHAMQRGILTVQATGNDGPSLYSSTGDVPWIFSVAASNSDRKIVNKAILGDGTVLVGTSINGFPSIQEKIPLLYGRQVTNTCSENDARIGPLLVAAMNKNEMNLVKSYQKSTKEPKVQTYRSEAIYDPQAPLIASFSSRGPCEFIGDIIKPDVTAHAVEILAAFSPMGSQSETFIDECPVKYSILSGTSMACPHVAAAAAFVKSFRLDWSPSAVKSALMTTTWEMNANQSLDVEFAYGSGHINPLKAKDPGLVYEISREDYFKIWCNISQSTNAGCHANLTIKELNYPSMAVQVDMNSAFVVSFPRTVTNIGKADSTYVASISGGTKLYITIVPDILQFTTLNLKRSFVVTVKGKAIKLPHKKASMSLLWTDSVHNVRSPIVVYTGNSTSSVGASAPRRFSQNFVILFVSILIGHCIYIF